MRRLLRSVPLLALGLTLGLTACRQPTSPGHESPDDGRQSKRDLNLPDPLPLPAAPRVATWLAQPSSALAMVAPYSPQPIDPRALAETALARLTEPSLAHEIAGAINLSAPFANVVLDDGQEVIRLSLQSEAREALAARLAKLEGVGKFGAVELPRSAPPGEVERAPARSWLVWIDEDDGGTLVLANSLEGLVTGRELAAAYGAQPVYFTVEPGSLALPVELPIDRVTGRGDLEHVVIEAQMTAGEDPLAELPVAAGTLSGLLAAPDIAAGATTRYADHEATVREITSSVNAEVRQLPFLVRSIGEDLAAKLNTLLRTWDGRTLVAIGPPNHLRIAYGAGDVAKSEVAMIRLLQKVVDNLSLARNFMARLPKVNLRRRVAKADGADIELLVLYEAHSTVPAELRPLVDGESRLNVAMAWSERAGGGLIVIGPDAVDQLKLWLEQTADAAPHSATGEQLAAATVAIEPELLVPLLGMGQPDLGKILGLAATGPKWNVAVVPRGEGRYEIDLRTPGPPKVARARTPN